MLCNCLGQKNMEPLDRLSISHFKFGFDQGMKLLSKKKLSFSPPNEKIPLCLRYSYMLACGNQKDLSLKACAMI